MKSTLARTPTLLLLAAYTAGCLLHIDRAPPWCTAVAAAAVLWHWLHFRGRIPLPHRLVRALLTLLLLGAVLVSFHTLGGLAAGSALLIVMGAAKLLETHSARDGVVVATVALVLVLAAGLDRQGLARLPFYLATAWLALASIAALGSRDAAAAARRAFLTSGRTALYAVPLAVLCFVLVPRLPGALWSMPGNERAQTGLGDEMSPGSISDLSISDDIAFRVRFTDAVPPPPQRYWRGPVLHEFDGYTWRRVPGQVALTQTLELLSPPLRYQVLLEPQGRSNLFALDTAERIDGPGYRRSFDGELLANRPITAPLIYDAVSHLDARSSETLSVLGRRIDTQLPQGRNPRSVALAHQLRGESGTDADFAAHVLDYFRSGGFEYTLTPPLLDYNSIDDLLFRTRLGFCGHFASAYVMLMRAGGVPARVVTGYLGGQWNPVNGYYTVRQSDAHAWAEVWLDGRGWTRFDPTGVVSPARLQRGASLLEGERSEGSALLGEANWASRLRDYWDAAGAWWLTQVVNFDRAKQMDLLAKLGLDRFDYARLALLLAAGAALWTALLLALLSRRAPRPARDALGRLWEQFLTLLQRRGVAVHDHDGPDAIRRRAQQQLPQAAGEIDLFAREYARLRYGRGGEREDAALRTLRTQLNRIARAARRSPAG